MGNKFDKLSSSDKAKIANDIESMRKEILIIHGKLTDYKFDKSNDNLIKIKFIAENLLRMYDVFMSQNMKYLGTIVGYRTLKSALIKLKHFEVTSDQKQFDGIYHDLEVADKLLLENRRKHFSEARYVVSSLTVDARVGTNGAEAGIGANIKREPNH